MPKAPKSDPTKDPEFKRTLKNLLSTPPKPQSEMTKGERKRKSDKPKKEKPAK